MGKKNRTWQAASSFNRRLIIALVLPIVLVSCAVKDNERFVEIQGHKQHILDIGSGEPVVVFLSGQGVVLETFDSVQREIAKITRTFSYDRAGLGKSEPLDTLRTLDNMVSELDQILEKEKIHPPYLLVGHSLGGAIARYYYHKHGENVAGMILIDPNHENYITSLINSRKGAARKSLDSLIHTIDPKWPKGLKDEITYSDYNYELLKGIRQPLNIPVALFISTKWDTTLEQYGLAKRDKELNKDLLLQWMNQIPDSKLILSKKSGHFIHKEEPELVIGEIKDMIKNIKR